jgi:hypothetical protein
VAFPRKKPAAIGAKVPYPGFIEPALATSVEKVPSGERWIHEISSTGYAMTETPLSEASKGAKCIQRGRHSPRRSGVCFGAEGSFEGWARNSSGAQDLIWLKNQFPIGKKWSHVPRVSRAAFHCDFHALFSSVPSLFWSVAG